MDLPERQEITKCIVSRKKKKKKHFFFLSSLTFIRKIVCVVSTLLAIYFCKRPRKLSIVHINTREVRFVDDLLVGKDRQFSN